MRDKQSALKQQLIDARQHQIPIAASGKPAVLRDGKFVDPDTGEVIAGARRTATGRFVKSSLMTYAEAKEYLQKERIPSRQQYLKWHDLHKPEMLSKWPHRVYGNEWLGWNDYLGNDNQFNSTVRWRSFTEGHKLAKQLRCPTMEQWLQLGREGRLPALVPSRPDLVYQYEWVNWKHWLGTEVVDLTSLNKPAAQVPDEVTRPVFFVIHEPGRPGNVLTVGIEPGGIVAMKARWESQQYELVRLFWYTETASSKTVGVLNATSSAMYGDPALRICPNTWNVIHGLSTIMEEVHLR